MRIITVGLWSMATLILLGNPARTEPMAAPPFIPAPTTVIRPPAPVMAVVENETRKQDLGDLLLGAEYLLLAPRRSGQTYAIVGTNPLWGPQGNIKSLDGSYDSGFRVGAGWRFPEKSWEIHAWYTYYHSAADDRVSATLPGAVFPTMTHPSTVMRVSSARAQNSINLNLVDLEVGKRVALEDSVHLYLFGGARYARLDQQISATYQGGDVVRDEAHRCLCFDGAGLRVGAEGTFDVLDHLGLYLRGSASLLTGRFQGCSCEVANGLTRVNVAEDFSRVIPIVDMGVGLNYRRGNWRITVGYEFINWFNMVEGLDFVDDAHPAKIARPTGSLGFDGFVLRTEWLF